MNVWLIFFIFIGMCGFLKSDNIHEYMTVCAYIFSRFNGEDLCSQKFLHLTFPEGHLQGSPVQLKKA